MNFNLPTSLITALFSGSNVASRRHNGRNEHRRDRDSLVRRNSPWRRPMEAHQQLSAPDSGRQWPNKSVKETLKTKIPPGGILVKI